MAGPTITVAVLGDSKDAERALDRTADAAEDMGSDVQRASRKARASLDSIDDGAGNTERGLRGLNDGFSGATSIMATFGLAAGGTVGTTVALVAGFTDLAGFVADFATQIPPLLVKMGLLTTATGAETTAQYALNTAFLTNPIFLVIAAVVALIAIFVVLVTQSETVRNKVTGALDAVRDTAMSVYHWVRDNWPLLLAILTGPFGLAVLAIVKYRDDIVAAIKAVPEFVAGVATDLFNKGVAFGKAIVNGVKAGVAGLGQALVDAGSFGLDLAQRITDALRDFINAQVIDRFNRAVEFKIGLPFGRSFTINPPDVPHLAAGGIVTGPLSGFPAILHGTEAVIPLNGSRAATLGTTIINYPNGYRTPRQVDNALRRRQRFTGGTGAPT